MVRKHDEQELTPRPQMFGGNETVMMRSLLNGPAEMNGKGRLYSVLSIPVGGSIGHHVHEHESETFYVLRGCGEFDDSGTTVAFQAGDVLYTAAGNGHAVKNTGSEVLEILALILYE